MQAQVYEGNRLKHEPVPADDDFTAEILKDLISQGYSGSELIQRFAEYRANIKKAMGILINEADEIAEGKCAGGACEDIFI